MNKSFNDLFEEKVKKGLFSCGCNVDWWKQQSNCLKIGLAVSGGADSISLLLSLCRIFYKTNSQLYVISINHNIREESETCGDVEYVESLCSELKKTYINLNFSRFDIARGKILDYAKQEKCGVEAAARKYRYDNFEMFIKENQLDYLCLAHNQDDHLETILMGFLQGSSGIQRNGISQTRGKYIRPLLQITRREIEQYLIENKVQWRTDSTNLDVLYLRNKIRLKLIPFLNENFNGWKTAVLNGQEKSEDEEKTLNKLAQNISFKTDEFENSILIEDNSFFESESPVKARVLLQGFNQLGITQRVPYGFLQDVIKSIDQLQACNQIADNSKNKIIKNFSNIKIIISKNQVFMEKDGKNHTDFTFFDIIKDVGVYSYDFGQLKVKVADHNKYALFLNNDLVCENLILPFCVRSFQPSDTIETADKYEKKIVDIYNDWHIPPENRWKLPIIQELASKEQKIICILGLAFGYKNWIVK